MIAGMLRKPGERGKSPTSSRPHAHRRAQHDLPPIQAGTRLSSQCTQYVGPSRLHSSKSGSCGPCAQGRQVKTEKCAGEVGERSREVIESFGLGQNGRDSDQALDTIGEGDGRDKSAEEGVGKVGGMEKGS